MDHVPGADFLQLDRAGVPAGRLAAWLTDALRAAAADGRLADGTRLPATRTLAGDLAVSRGVVVEAYRRLTDEGLLVADSGRGTVVRAPIPVRRPSATASAAPSAELDLSPGLPDLSAFPRAAWLRAERDVLAGLRASDLGYGDPRGTPALRTALSGWLARTRGVRAGPDDLVVVNGVAQALSLLAQVLTARGTRHIGFEDPGSAGTRGQLERWGLQAVPVPVDGAGLQVDALRATGVGAVVVTPAHQFPTGVVLAPERRRELLAWARAGGTVVEDDYDAEHRYDRPPVPALHALAPDLVVHAGSVSKTLAPALRLGWVLAPAALRADLVEAKRWTDLQTPALGQLVLARLVESGGFERHLRSMRARYRRRRDAVLDELARVLPGARAHGVAAGLHLLVTLPGDVDDRSVSAQALRRGVRVPPLSEHRRLPGPPGLVVGYAAHPPDRLRDAVRRIAACLPP